MTTVTESEQRSEYTAGLRALADLLDANPDVPVPHSGSSKSFAIEWILANNPHQRELLAVVARFIPGAVRKDASTKFFDISGKVRGLHLHAWADRNEVCTRRVVGTHQETKQIPDPAASLVEVTETVEEVEWDCGPILAPAGKAAV